MKKKKRRILVVVLLVAVLMIILFCLNSRRNKPSVNLKLVYDGESISGTYEIGDALEFNFLGQDFTLKIDDISDEKVMLSSSTDGLSPVDKEGKINLKEKIKNFELYKNESLKLAVQATDVFGFINIIWE